MAAKKLEQMSYDKLNLYSGWLVFLFSAIVYLMTIEDTVSFWDCGEYITAAYKLETGHPPGAPLFMLLGRLFSFFAEPQHAAAWINRMSAISSAATILFLFWSITMLAGKIMLRENKILSGGNAIAVLGSGFVGAMAYTFSDSFWFSAVEGEVYVLSSLFTSVILWAILKWREETEVNCTIGNEEQRPARWILLICLLFGLSVGVHLLGLLLIPTIAYMIYFNQRKSHWKGFLLTGFLALVILGLIYEGVIPGIITLASVAEVFFVNNLGMPFHAGTVVFFGILTGSILLFIRLSRKKNKPILHTIGLGCMLFLIGYGAFATIVIRSNANTPMNENNPADLVNLHAYLQREQYGTPPFIYGPYWNSKPDKRFSWGSIPKKYVRGFTVTDGQTVIKNYIGQADAQAYASQPGKNYKVQEKYLVINEKERLNALPAYTQNTLFPRMYWTLTSDTYITDAYKQWSGYSNRTIPRDTITGSDGERLPSFAENMTYFFSYQVNWMYWRYFMWNFAGRQNDFQGHGDQMRGNWISGIEMIDEMRLGSQGEHAPFYTSDNTAHNRFFFFPLILGLIGMFLHFRRIPKDAFIVFLTFLFTGLAIVIYLNQKPMEPRERDYAYTASFYAFTIWIGLSVIALYQAFISFRRSELKFFSIFAAAGAILFFLLDRLTGNYALLASWIFICFVAILLLTLMSAAGTISAARRFGAFLSIMLAAAAPVIMGLQGWDDHDRSGKTSARDMAVNYLQSCKKNALLFTSEDNDTFPLWYLQEVEEKRTDVRVCNLSLLANGWYAQQMKRKTYDSPPLPISFTEDQLESGNTQQVYFMSLIDMLRFPIPRENLEKIYNSKISHNKLAFGKSFEMLRTQILAAVDACAGKNAQEDKKLADTRHELEATIVHSDFEAVRQLLNIASELSARHSAGKMEDPNNKLPELRELLRTWEKTWDYLPIDEAMAFTRDDRNLFQAGETPLLTRIFPCRGFILPVDKENAVHSGIITEQESGGSKREIRFSVKAPALLRDQLILLDLLAVNQWKRPIYFSAPHLSEVPAALLEAGYIRQNGSIYELSPLPADNNHALNMNRMYHNLMNVYNYGKMNQPGVLNDFYTRRALHYRNDFLKLAEAYMRNADKDEEQKATLTARFVETTDQKMSELLQKKIQKLDYRIASNKRKTIALIRKSLAVMPPDRFTDYGNPSENGRDLKTAAGIAYPAYSDGVLQDYVMLLYRAGDGAAGEKLGSRAAAQIETILNFFEESSPEIAYRNKPDLISALSNYMLIAMISSDETLGNPGGKLAIRTNGRIRYLYKNVFGKKYSELLKLAKEHGENPEADEQPGYYTQMLIELKGHLDATARQFGYTPEN